MSAGTLAIIEQKLGWMPGSARTILDGGEPVVQRSLVAAVSAAAEEALRIPSPQPSAAALRGLSEAYGIAAELTERGDTRTGNRLVQALGRIGRVIMADLDEFRGPNGELADDDELDRQTLPPELWRGP